MQLNKKFDENSLSDYFNMVHCLSKLPLCLNISGKIVTHDRFFSKYCQYIRSVLPDICDPEYIKDQELHMCGAGLWCATLPIKSGNDTISYLSIGHKRIEGEKDLKTKQKLEELFKSGKISSNNYNLLKEYLEEVEVFKNDKYDDVIKRYVPPITKYLVSEKQHEDRIKELKTLSTYLAHSFLSPIQAIVARSENLLISINEKTEYVDVELIENCRSIIEEVTKLSNSAENLRDWMGDEDEVYKINLDQNVSIYKSLREAIDLFRTEASFRGIIIDAPISNMPFPYIMGSIPHMRKAFINLINNAVKYSFDGFPGTKRHIEIYCDATYRRGKRYYCIEITNYGVGILPDEKERVFEYYYRGKLARDRNRFGSGVGLAAVKRIIEAHGGSVGLDSEMIEKTFDGSKLNLYRTTIKVYLPLAEDEKNG